jgi:hypothetical protein
MHWKRSANFLDEFPEPVRTIEEIEALISHRGIGPNTVSTLKEIQQFGYLDFIDDLHAEVEVIREGDERYSTRIEDIRERAEQFGVRSAESRAQRREMARQRQSRDVPVHQKVNEAIAHAVRITGAQKKKLVEAAAQRQEAGETSTDLQYTTRAESKRKRIRHALEGAAKAEDACAVCLEVYQDDEQLVAFECQHCFHFECVRMWLDERVKNSIAPSCPLCRTPISLPED